MQYILCPRCQFRIPINKHICSTCGFVLPSSSDFRGINDSASVVQKSTKTGFWRSFFGLEPPAEEGKDPGHEEPALGKV